MNWIKVRLKKVTTIQMCLRMLDITSQRISNTIFFFGRWEGGVHTPGPTLKGCVPLQQVIFPAQVQFNKAGHPGQVISLSLIGNRFIHYNRSKHHSLTIQQLTSPDSITVTVDQIYGQQNRGIDHMWNSLLGHLLQVDQSVQELPFLPEKKEQ